MSKQPTGGRALAALRRRAKLTQAQLAEAAGCDPMTVSRIERNAQAGSEALRGRLRKWCELEIEASHE